MELFVPLKKLSSKVDLHAYLLDLSLFQLPIPCSQTHPNLPESISRRLHYEWRLIHQLATTSLALSHTLRSEITLSVSTYSPLGWSHSRGFAELCRSYCIGSSSRHFLSLPLIVTGSVDLEECVPRRLCSWCSIIQIPTVTCRVRLRHRTKRSKVNQSANKNKTTKRKIKNEIVYHCLTCDRISSREDVCKKPLSAAAASSTTLATPVAIRAAAATAGGSSSVDPKLKRDKQKFNFLEMLSQNRGIGTGTPPPAQAVAKSLSLSSGAGLDFIPLCSPPTLLSVSRSSSEAGGGGDATAGHRTPMKRVSLLELEENRKSNKKRKSLGSQEAKREAVAGEVAGNGIGGGREGLGSLRSLFSQPSQGAAANPPPVLKGKATLSPLVRSRARVIARADQRERAGREGHTCDN
jgi:hypothetical protein